MPSLSSTTESVFEPTTSSAAHLPSIAVSFTPSSAISTASRSIIKTTLSTMTENLNLPPTTPPRMNPTTAGFANIATTSSSSSIPTIMSSSGTEKIIHVAELSSSLQHFGFVDYFVFVLMLVVCAVIGIYFGFVEKKKKNNRTAEKRRGSEALDYLVGSRKMQVIPVALSLVASFVSGISLLGTSTEIYVYGTQYAFILLTLAISGIISWYVFLPVFCNLQLTSTYEYFEMRFDKNIRLFGSVLFTIGTILWLPIVIYVPALAFNQVTGVNLHIITPVVCIVCIFYTTVGGLKAVVWTDVVQTFIMFGSILLVIIKGTSDVGGLGVVLQRNWDSGRIEAPDVTLDPTVRFSMISVFVGGTLYSTQLIAGNQVMMQRYLSVSSLKQARKALCFFVIGVTILVGCCCYNGLLLYATYYDCDPLTTKLAKAKDQLVPLLVMDILKFIPGMPGLFVAGVFSAALSSLSTGLNSLSAVFLEDYIKPYKKIPLTEKQTAFVMRSLVVTLGISCVGLAFVVEKMGTVIQLSMTMNSITNGPLFGLFIMGVLMPWINGKSALTGSVIAFVIMTWICIKAQLDIAAGELAYPEKLVSTEGCTYLFEAVPSIAITNTTAVTPETRTIMQYIYHMSFTWYVTVGGILATFFGSLATLVFGKTDPRTTDLRLFPPFIRKFVKPDKYITVQPDERESVILSSNVNGTLNK